MSFQYFSSLSDGTAQRHEHCYPATGLTIDRVELTVVLPVFNEQDVITRMYRRLKSVMEQLDMSYEVLFVDDGSRDSTAAAILEISRDDESVAGVFLSRHFGKEAALAAGLGQAKGHAVVIMDGDLQDPPEHIPQMVQAWKAGADVVRMRPSTKKAASLLHQASRSVLFPLRSTIDALAISEHRADFMLYSRRAVSVLGLVVNRKRYMKDIFEWAGLRETIIDYERQSRIAGSSKWSFTEFLGYSCDGTKAFVDMLLRVLVLAGLSGFVAGLLHACYAFFVWATSTDALWGPSFVSWGQFLVVGSSLYLVGWLGETIARACPPMRRPHYSIKQVVRSDRIPIQQW